MKFRGTLIAPRINVLAWRNALDRQLSQAIEEAAHAWLNATVVSLIPAWSGASRSTFVKLAREAKFSLPIGKRSIAPDRRGKGSRQSDGGITTDKRAGQYHFFFATTLEHLIYNELNNANMTPDPTLFGRLVNPGPYHFQQAGQEAFRRFAARVRLPNPCPFLRQVRFQV